jgi:TRAP-type C4-dicarboxylate transport system permease small subunit
MDSVLIKVLDGFAAGVRKLNAGTIYVGMVAISIISIVALIGIGSRMIGSPVSWTLEFLQLIQVVLAFVPVAYVLNQNAHVRMEAGVAALHGKHRHFLEGVASLLGMCGSIVMTYATSQTAFSSVAMREGSVLTSLPVYPFKVCVAIGFLLLTLQFAGNAWESFRRILFPAAEIEAVSPHVYL